MDEEWLGELGRCEDRVREAVRALLDHSGASGTCLRLDRTSSDPTYILIARAESIDSLDPRQKMDWRSVGPVTDRTLATLPEPVREGIEELVEASGHPATPSRH